MMELRQAEDLGGTPIARAQAQVSSPVKPLIESLRKLRVTLVVLLATLVVAPISMLPYAADDLINRTWATFSWSKSWHSVLTLQHTWISEQGRFFPGGALYAVPMWHVLDTRTAYFTYLVLLNLACLALVAFVCLRVSRSASVAVVGVAALGACMEVRWQGFDGISSFGGLIPYIIVLTILSALGAAQFLRSGRLRWLIAAAVLWTLAVTAYEVSLLMLPAMILLLVVANRGHGRRDWTWALAPLVIPALAEAGIDVYLHTRASAAVPAYQVNLGGPVGSTFLKQFTAALPSSQYWLDGWKRGITLSPTLSLMLVVFVALPAFIAWRPHFAFEAVPKSVSLSLVAAGSWAWVVPSLLIGVTRRWQGELIFGQGYISLPFEYVGIGLICAGIAGLLSGSDRSRRVRFTVVALLAFALVGSAIAAGSNIYHAGAFVPGPQSGSTP
jgi:hypothetical protein